MGARSWLSDAERLKFRLLAEGLSMSSAARAQLDELRGERKLTPADYPSTTGVILRLEDDAWVNAPISDNHEFVAEPRSELDVSCEGFLVRGGGLESHATIWLPPLYHDRALSTGRRINHFVYTHGDRVRLSPIRGCAMRCKFCNMPYEDPYDTKPVDLMIEALEVALSDPLQPAQHIMISGGTPKPSDVPFLRNVYERVLLSFPDRHVDIMMAPLEGVFDLLRLEELGVHELSINLELFNPEIARSLMPQKHKQSVSQYLDFIAEATAVLGPGRVRSMLMVGLEPAQDTLAGVRAILQAGGVPVLSPFRPDPATPLRDVAPLSAEEYEDIFLRANEIAADAGAELGPSCAPCTHNTLTLVRPDHGEAAYPYPLPVLV